MLNRACQPGGLLHQWWFNEAKRREEMAKRIFTTVPANVGEMINREQAIGAASEVEAQRELFSQFSKQIEAETKRKETQR